MVYMLKVHIYIYIYVNRFGPSIIGDFHRIHYNTGPYSGFAIVGTRNPA